jgi:protein SCO1/2
VNADTGNGRVGRWAVVLLLVALLVATACGGRQALTGTNLEGTPAPDFKLTDDRGEALALSDLRGKVVVLTFLYTSCADTCPLIAGKLAQVHDEFGAKASDLAFVIVTVDPARDTVQRVRRYLQERGWQGKLTYLTGSQAAVQSVWKQYGIGVIKQPPVKGAGGFYEVAHIDAIYLIDAQGRERALMKRDFAPADLARNLQTLLRERGAS